MVPQCCENLISALTTNTQFRHLSVQQHYSRHLPQGVLPAWLRAMMYYSCIASVCLLAVYLFPQIQSTIKYRQHYLWYFICGLWAYGNSFYLVRRTLRLPRHPPAARAFLVCMHTNF